MALLFAYIIKGFRWVAHLFVAKGLSPEIYRRLVRSIYERLVFDPCTQTVTVICGPLKGMKKCGPFREGDFDFAVGRYERETSDALCRFCRGGMTVFDVGANAGYLTLLMSRLVGDSGRVHAFEPIPQNCQYLLETLRINGLRNVIVHQVAISNQRGEARMNYVGTFDGFATLTDGGHDYYTAVPSEMISVATISLDQFCTEMQITEIGLIKMDIEGAELLTLAGMSQIFAVQRPVMIVEFWGAKNFHEGVGMLTSKGYNAKVLNSWSGFVWGMKADIQNVLALPM